MESRTDPEVRTCVACSMLFPINADDFGFYEKMGVPPPQKCFGCRFKQRLLFRNERNFYRRTCDLCKGQIIATYPQEVPFPVYCVKCWWSDAWDAHQYGREFDFSRPFFEQFGELMRVTPVIALMNDDGIASANCQYSYDWFYSKNCYMTICGWHVENGMYLHHVEQGKDMADCLNVKESELAYECSVCYKISRCIYCVNCRECQECFLSEDLQGCSNCTMCVGLRNKHYHILNTPYSKEAYFEKLRELNLQNRESLEVRKKEFEKFALKFPRRYAYILKSVHTTGNFSIYCKNAEHVFFANGIENSKFVVINDGGKELYDCNMTGQAELCYNCNVADHSYASVANSFCFKSRFVEHSQLCPSAEHCFGCMSLKKGSYSILNTQHGKDAYEKLRAKIIAHMKQTGEWGEFFPYPLIPFAYNESAAQEWFPLAKTEAEKQGYRWKEPAARDYKITKKPEELPPTIEGVHDDILNETIGCLHAGTCGELCTTAFRIVPAELQLYRRCSVPLPQLCPNCRHFARVTHRGGIKLHRRQCQCAGNHSVDGAYENSVAHAHSEQQCAKTFETPYAPSQPEIVYCEDCYNAEVA